MPGKSMVSVVSGVCRSWPFWRSWAFVVPQQRFAADLAVVEGIAPARGIRGIVGFDDDHAFNVVPPCVRS